MNSHRSSPSQHSREMTLSTEPPVSPLSTVTPNHHSNYYNQDTHSTPIRANLVHKEEWQLESPLATGYGPSPSSGHRGTPNAQEMDYREIPYQNGHQSPQKFQRSHWPSDDLENSPRGRGGSQGQEAGWKEVKPMPEFIPEEEGVQQLYPNQHRRHTTRTMPPHLHFTQYVHSHLHACLINIKFWWQA